MQLLSVAIVKLKEKFILVMPVQLVMLPLMPKELALKPLDNANASPKI